MPPPPSKSSLSSCADEVRSDNFGMTLIVEACQFYKKTVRRIGEPFLRWLLRGIYFTMTLVVLLP